MTAQAAEDQDQSMEEILQSIKRIIADEDEDTPAPAKNLGSDVLELTEMVQDDGTVTKASFEPPASKGFESAMMPARPVFEEGLVSDKTASASAAAMRSLMNQPKEEMKPMPKIDSPSFRSGNTVEDLMMEAMRPMLKAWLDANLQPIVEHLVEREVRRIAGK